MCHVALPDNKFLWSAWEVGECDKPTLFQGTPSGNDPIET